MTELTEAGRESPNPLYVYAIVSGAASVHGMTGLNGSDFDLVEHEATAAVVSAYGSERVRPSRANLLAHQQVVAELHARGPVLPVRFATVLPGRDAVVDELLEPGAEHHVAALRDLVYRDEFRLKVRYIGDVALRESVERSPAIRRLRSRVQEAGTRAKPRDQLLLGEMVFAELERIREDDAAAWTDYLDPYVEAMTTMDTQADDVALSAALLVERRHGGRFEEAVDRIGRKEHGRLHIELVGPLPAWDFAESTVGAR